MESRPPESLISHFRYSHWTLPTIVIVFCLLRTVPMPKNVRRHCDPTKTLPCGNSETGSKTIMTQCSVGSAQIAVKCASTEVMTRRRTPAYLFQASHAG